MKQLDIQEIGRRLKRIRKALKIRQDLFAEKMNFSKTSISDYENGKKKPPFDLLVSLHTVFNVDLHFLVFGEGNMFHDKNGPPPEESDLLAPLGEFSEHFANVIETMKISPYARTSIYSMTQNFFYKNSKFIRQDIKHWAAKQKKENQKKGDKNE